MDNPSLVYYRHSGYFTAPGILVSLFVGALATLVVAFVYAYVILYCPFIYINFFATLIYGGAVGFVAATLLKKQKVRSTQAAVAVGVLLGLVAVWAEWVVWMYGFLGRAEVERNLLGLFFVPSALWALILQVNEVGAWTLHGSDAVTGWPLWMIWGLEAAVIAGTAIFAAVAVMDGEPYCESCGTWCEEEKNIAELKTCDPGELKRRVESKDLGFLESLGARAAGASEWLHVKLFNCKQCGMTNTLTVDSVSVTLDKKNRETKNTVTLLDKLLVTPAERERIREMGRKLQAPAAPQV